MILTPQTINKLNNEPLEVRRWNGNFNRVQLRKRINRKDYYISVQHADESLRDYGVLSSVYEEPVEFFYNHVKVKEIPAELQPLIDKMKEACKMTPEQTAEIKADMIEAIRAFRREFCI